MVVSVVEVPQRNCGLLAYAQMRATSECSNPRKFARLPAASQSSVVRPQCLSLRDKRDYHVLGITPNGISNRQGRSCSGDATRRLEPVRGRHCLGYLDSRWTCVASNGRTPAVRSCGRPARPGSRKAAGRDRQDLLFDLLIHLFVCSSSHLTLPTCIPRALPKILPTVTCKRIVLPPSPCSPRPEPIPIGTGKISRPVNREHESGERKAERLPVCPPSDRRQAHGAGYGRVVWRRRRRARAAITSLMEKDPWYSCCWVAAGSLVPGVAEPLAVTCLPMRAPMR